MTLEFRQEYRRMMEPVRVTPEMRARILNNLESMDLTQSPAAKVFRFPNWKQLTALAACLAVLIAGTLFYQSRMQTGQQGLEQPVEQVQNGIVEMDSLDALCQAVGFEVEPLGWLPFQPENTTYTSYWGYLAQITYTGQDETAVYRMALGSDDVSGDYNVYEAETELSVNDLTVTLKGGADGYTLAVWTDGTYSYSVSLSAPMSQEDWTLLIAGMDS